MDGNAEWVRGKRKHLNIKPVRDLILNVSNHQQHLHKHHLLSRSNKHITRFAIFHSYYLKL